MKKTLFIALLIAASSIAQSAIAYTDTGNSTYKKSIDFLTQYNIISGYGEIFNPTGYLTRAESAKMILYAKNIGEEDLIEEDEGQEGVVSGAPFGINEISYADISSEHWGYPYIQMLSSIGILSGFEDGTIRPDDMVTCAQFVKMAICSVGYGIYAEEAGGYPNGYYTIAKTLNITGKITDINLDAFITREMAAQILYHTIQTPLVAIESYAFEENVLVPKFQILDGTDDTVRTTLLSRIQADSHIR